ncbi:adenosine/AMP deaminase family protein [Desulfovibrio sp. A2]|nr:adenosine/AMP deaminase family protein [Desulfovibrio sp. A2]
MLTTSLFNNHLLLHRLSRGDNTPNFREIIENIHFTTARNGHSKLPDHLIKNWMARANAEGKTDLAQLIANHLDHLVEHTLAMDGEDIFVQSRHFELWQEIIGETSPLLLLAWKISKDTPHIRSRDAHVEQLIHRNIQPHVFPGLHAPLLEERLRRMGLCDLHIHLNGSTPSDVVWLDALASPRKFRARMAHEHRHSRKEIEELLLQTCPLFDWRDLCSLIDIAAGLRDWLVRRLFASTISPVWIPSGEQEPACLPHCHLHTPDACGKREHQLHCSRYRWWGRLHHDMHLSRYTFTGVSRQQLRIHPLQKYFPSRASRFPRNLLHQEACFLVHALTELRTRRDDRVATFLFYYLSIQSLFTRLLVQQADQYGFDQFQKITLTGLREEVESSYPARMIQFAASSTGHEIHVEGRFAPKSNFIALHTLLRKINRGDIAPVAFRAPGRHPSPRHPASATPPNVTLSLVAHLIKQKDEKTHRGAQHYRLRRALQKQVRHLLNYINHPQNQKHLAQIVGFDAASNELHTPPEVFAPAFRQLRRGGQRNFTFHVGEDFQHLASGIRAVHEAITFLDLGAGNRIGHGTAVGIAPKLWRQRVGPSICLLRAEWLDTLVYAHQTLSGSACYSDIRSVVEGDIHQHSRAVYGRPLTPETLWQAWLLRKLDPIRCFIDKDKTQCLSLKEREEEWGMIERHRPAPRSTTPNDAHSSYDDPYQVFAEYHQKHVFAAYNPQAGTSARDKKNGAKPNGRYVDVATDYFTDEALAYMQIRVLKEIVDRKIAIESMITSNVRISFYQGYDEHHILRWLGLDPNFTDEPHPTVCLGTDDPGIFATTMKNECLHLLGMLTRRGKSEAKAVDIIARLVENSHAYSFKIAPPAGHDRSCNGAGQSPSTDGTRMTANRACRTRNRDW